MIWKGGMSFHGAVVGIIISTYLFSIKYKINIFYFLDLVALSAPIGIFLGRISNFINSELYGRETDVFWSVKFILVDNLNRHPSQLYEAILEGLILFLILNFLFSRANKQHGYISSLFLINYSIFRFIIEYTREPDAHIGFLIFNLTTGQVISIIVFILGSLLWFSKKMFEKKKIKIPLDEFIDNCLYHPKHGYYMQKFLLEKMGTLLLLHIYQKSFSEMILIWIISA